MLQRGSHDEIIKMFGRMRNDVNGLIHSLLQLVYYMRGGIQYNDIFWITYSERQMMQTFIDKRLEMESTKPFPIY